MTDISALTSQIKQNCNISDAKFWGNYTICILLLGLRELYKFEHNLSPWEDVKKESILEWIAEREKLWAELEDKDFVPIELSGKQYDAFDSESINAKLLPEGLFYAAGYGQRMKPSFFLAELYQKNIVEGYSVYIAGKELTRDIAVYPAMLQGRNIIIRKDVIISSIWEKFNELRANRSKSALNFAFNFYGISADEELTEELISKIIRIAESEIETYIYHETGEMFEGDKLGEQWKNFLFLVSGTKAEYLARGLKDILADTSEKGTIKHLVKSKSKGSLGFYVASLRGYRKSLFNEIRAAFDRFVISEDWDEIETERLNCYEKTARYARALLDLYANETDRTKLIKDIEAKFPDLLK